MHKFTGVFYGTPAETTTNWPATTTAADVLTSPIYESTSTLLFVGGSDGYLYSVSTGATPTVVKSALLMTAGATGIVDAPLVDEVPATPLVYAFVGDSTGATALVEKFATNFTGGTNATTTYDVSSVSGSATTFKLYSGAFDNIHYTVGGTAGSMYVCGDHSTVANPNVFEIALSTGTVTSFVQNTSGVATCSPVTEFLGAKANTTINEAGGITAASTSVTVTSNANIAAGDYIQIDSEIIHVSAVSGGTTVSFTVAGDRGALGTTAVAHANGAAVQDIQDWIYLSVSATGNDTTCSGACLYNYNVTTGPTTGTATTGINAAGGTSGVIIDNSAPSSTNAASGEAQIYYSTLATQACTGNGTTGNGTQVCAVQTSQSAP